MPYERHIPVLTARPNQLPATQPSSNRLNANFNFLTLLSINRPLESGDHLLAYPQLKNGVNGQDVQDLVANTPGAAAALYRSDNNYQYYYGDNPIGYLPVGLTNDNHNLMDGLRLQLNKRKGVSLRSPPVRRSTESQVTLRGWLYRLEGAALKQWKRRWCVLADYCLFYYKGMPRRLRCLHSSRLSSARIE